MVKDEVRDLLLAHRELLQKEALMLQILKQAKSLSISKAESLFRHKEAARIELIGRVATKWGVSVESCRNN